MKNKTKSFFIFLLFLIIFISAYSVNAVVSGLGLTIWVHNVTDKGTNGFGYGAGGFNYTNVSTNRPYITFNVSTTFYLDPLQANNSFNVTLNVVAKGGGLGSTTASQNNMTIFMRNQTSIIYFNQSFADGYYTWYLNVTNDSLSTLPPAMGAGNASNVTDFYTILIDTNAPNITYLATSVQNGLAVTTNLTYRSLFINVSTNDTLDGTIDTVGGGSVTFELHNRTTGLLNRTVFNRDVFGSTVFFAFRNLSFMQNNDLYDDRYEFNVSVNDSLGNIRYGSTSIIYVDTTSPNISYNSNSQATDANLTIGTIFINVSTNDTLGGKGQVSGGFVVFNLHNDSGLLNATSFERTVFAEDLILHNWINVSYKKVADLADGYYWYNVTVNDSLNNIIVVTQRNVTVDKTATNATFASQGPSTVSTNLTVRRIFINVTTNDTNLGRVQVGGGSIQFQIRNGSGVLNTTQFELPFLRDRVQHNFINMSYKVLDDLYDDIYILNYTINDTAGNTFRGAELTVYVDTTSPTNNYLNIFTGYSQSSSIIFVNVTSNDTLGGKGQVSGGFVSFYLRNESGVLNWSVRPRNVFAADLVASTNVTFLYNGLSSFTDGVYLFNVSVNDSLGKKKKGPPKEKIL